MKEFDLSSSYVAGENSGAIASSCMDFRIPYAEEGAGYSRALKIAGVNNYAPEEISDFAKLLSCVRVQGKPITIVESHHGCGGGLRGYLKYLEHLGTIITKDDAKQRDVDNYSKKYAQYLAEAMNEERNGKNEVRAVHLNKKDMEKFRAQYKSTPEIIYVSREPLDPTAYRNQNGEKLIGGFTIGGAGISMQKYIESVELALKIAMGAEKHGDDGDSNRCIVNVVVVGKSGNKNHVHTSRSLMRSSDLYNSLEAIARTEEYAGKVAITQLPVRPDCKNFSANAIPRYVPEINVPYARIPTSQNLWENAMLDSAMPDMLRL